PFSACSQAAPGKKPPGLPPRCPLPPLRWPEPASPPTNRLYNSSPGYGLKSSLIDELRESPAGPGDWSSPLALGSLARHAHSLMAPNVSPVLNCFRTRSAKITMGITVMLAEAAISPQTTPWKVRNWVTMVGSVRARVVVRKRAKVNSFQD